MAELKITAANFENEVLHSDKPVLLDFYADWCGPCKMLSPILHELAEEKSGALKVGKINVDEQMELAMRFQVSSIPMLVVFKGHCNKWSKFWTEAGNAQGKESAGNTGINFPYMRYACLLYTSVFECIG